MNRFIVPIACALMLPWAGPVTAASPAFILQWGHYGGLPGEFNNEQGIAVDDQGFVYVADMDNFRIQKFAADGSFAVQWGTEGVGDGQFLNPTGVATDHLGHVYVLDNTGRIQKFTNTGSFLASWGDPWTGSAFHGWGLAVGPDNTIYASRGEQVVRLSSDGETLSSWDHGSACGLDFAVDGAGQVFVANMASGHVEKYSASGDPIGAWALGTGCRHLWLAVDGNGYIYVTDLETSSVSIFTNGGTLVTRWDVQGAGEGEFYWPRGIAVDADGNVYVADQHNERIQKLGPLAIPVPTMPVTWGALKTRYR